MGRIHTHELRKYAKDEVETLKSLDWKVVSPISFDQGTINYCMKRTVCGFTREIIEVRWSPNGNRSEKRSESTIGFVYDATTNFGIQFLTMVAVIVTAAVSVHSCAT